MKRMRIRPEQEGLKTTLFDLEAEIMELVWEEAWPSFTVTHVHEILQERRDVAYTTIMTTISRLFEKEILVRQKEGRKYVYQTAMTRSAFIAKMTKEVLNSLPPVGQETAIAFLVDHVSDASEEELDRLEALIRARRGKT